MPYVCENSPPTRSVWAPFTHDSESENCQRFWVVPCGTRKLAPSWMLGNVSCRPGLTGSIWLRNRCSSLAAC